MSKFTKLNADAFKHLVLNAGMLVQGFNPSSGTYVNILGATTGGISFATNPTYEDFGEDVDQAPNNMKELKKLTAVDPVLSGTFLEVNRSNIAALVGNGTPEDYGSYYRVKPRANLLSSDFADIWFVGDYSDVNTGESAGFLAIRLINALNTAGFQITTTKNGKGQFAVDFHGHYSIDDPDNLPYEIYCSNTQAGGGSADFLFTSYGNGTCGLTACRDLGENNHEAVIPFYSPAGDVVIRIENSAFEDVSAELLSVVIPAGVTRIDIDAFSDCPLTLVKIYAVDPPPISDDHDHRTFDTSPTFLVPAQSVSAYKNAAKWGTYYGDDIFAL